jgi:cytochrome c-type biogenesis protein
MGTPDISLWMAFFAGLVSFLSPCVLPLVPGYVSFISGVSVEQIQAANEDPRHLIGLRYRIFINAFLFVAGFSLVFVLLGATATWIGSFLSARLGFLTRVAGLVLIFFGIFKLGLIRWLFLLGERRVDLRWRGRGWFGALVLGACFAFGWTPCIGPVLGAILAYAGTLTHSTQGIVLMAFYSVGLGVPFLLTAAGIHRFMRFFGRFKRYLGLVEKATGAVLIVLGVMMMTDTLTLIPGYLSFLNRFAL